MNIERAVGSWQFFRLLKRRRLAYRGCCCQSSVSLSGDFPIASVFKNLLPSKQQILKLSAAGNHSLTVCVSISSPPVTRQWRCWCQRSNGNWAVVRPVVDRGMNGPEKKAKESWGKGRSGTCRMSRSSILLSDYDEDDYSCVFAELSQDEEDECIITMMKRCTPPPFFSLLSSLAIVHMHLKS